MQARISIEVSTRFPGRCFLKGSIDETHDGAPGRRACESWGLPRDLMH